MTKKTLGVSALYHDLAAAISVDGKVVAAAKEEQFIRKNHDAGFPANAIKYCLQYAGAAIDDLDAIAIYNKPLLKFEQQQLLETYYACSPKVLISFITAMPVWLKEKIFLKKR